MSLHTSRPTEGVVLIEIDNPPANALGEAMRAKMTALLDELEADTSVRALVITGRGKTFCTGDDLREAAARGRVSPEAVASFNAMLDRLEAFRAPVLAAVNGHCVGGGLEVALSADIRLASTAAIFTAAGVNVGLMASAWRLPRAIGVARAKLMLLTGLPVTAAEALENGLVAAVHEPPALVDEAVKLAGRIASRAPLSTEATKRIAGRALNMTPQEADAAVMAEIAVLSASEDHAGAVAAFAERREPVFRRR
ncbi:MAG TPA: enoyl-CoA hydratase-related protein [Caulobacteraceae bacterium]|nr:enoyl-CoA hydratase-related protein [Caulobacteraceae bacterium]